MRTQPAPTTTRTSPEMFTGAVYMDPLFGGEEGSRLSLGLVRFTPGARTNWHSHPAGQLLHCTDGHGLVVVRDGTTAPIAAGDTVWSPAGEEHWHGAGSETMMAHLTVLETPEGSDPATWLEPVSDEDYAAADRSSPGPAS